MKRTSHHANILMSGHNPEHHNSKGSHRGTSNVNHHLKKHKEHNISHEGKSAKPSDILMRQHHFHGGISSATPQFAKGGRTTRRFATGGHVDNDESAEERREHKRGGRAKRQKHGFGGLALDPGYSGNKNSKDAISSFYTRNSAPPLGEGFAKIQSQGPSEWAKRFIAQPHLFLKGYKKGGHCYAEGGEAKEYGEKPLTGQLRKGGRAKRRDHHYDGEPVGDNSVRQEQKKGGRSKRQHHYWGQNFIGRLPLIGGIANSIANTAGTLDPKKYGGAEYVADTKGRKAADIFATLGNLGASAVLSRGGGKGAPAAAPVPRKKGGGVRQHHAAGGSGKVRKGMMTKSGHMIHSKI